MAEIRFLASVPVGVDFTMGTDPDNDTMSFVQEQLPFARFDPDFDVTITLPGGYGEGAFLLAGESTMAQYRLIRGATDEDGLARMANDLDDVTVWSDPIVEPLRCCCLGDPAIGTALDVQQKLVPPLRAAGMDGTGVALAIVDNGINLTHLRVNGLNPKLDTTLSSTRPGGRKTPGQARIGYGNRGHGTMCAYDALLLAPNATLLDIAALRPTDLNTLLSDVVAAYSDLLVMMLDPNRPYQSLVVSNSWGVLDPKWDAFPPGDQGRYIDNRTHVFEVVIDNLIRAGADIVFAAGNCGPVCPCNRCGSAMAAGLTINGANSHPEVMTVGAVDINGTLAGYSAEGPGTLSPWKPDILGYTHFAGSNAYRGQPDQGTSAAAPVVAGAIAALRSKFPFDGKKIGRSPASVKQMLIDEAQYASGTGNFSNNFGWGPLSTGRFDQSAVTARIA